MRHRTTLAAAVLTVAVVTSGAGPAGAAVQDPVYTCQSILVDDANRVGGTDCTGGPADYEGPGTIKSADSGPVWRCDLVGSAEDATRPGKLTVFGSFGCERSDNDATSW